MNKNILINAAMFVAGAAVGSYVTFKVLDSRYEVVEECDEETEEEGAEPEVVGEPAVKRADVVSYNDIISKNNYNDIEAEIDKVIEELGIEERKVNDMNKDKPYVIPPDELGDNYPIVTLTYYANGVLTEYDSGEVVDDVEDTVGPDALDSFGEYEDDSVFVRNDVRKIDYEILRDEDDYSDDYRQYERDYK